MKILYVLGILPEWPKALRPLPPLDSGAPHSNIFRLVEHLAASPWENGFRINVVSAVGPEQLNILKREWPEGSYVGNYEWVVIPPSIRKISSGLLKFMPLSCGVLRRTNQADSLQSLFFIKKIYKIYKKLQPDIVILDDGPQFIKGLTTFIPRQKFIFFCRGDMGVSRRDLHKARLIIVTNDSLGKWLQEINPQISHYAIVRNTLAPEYENIAWSSERFQQEIKRIIFVGRIEPYKGVEYLIKAFARVVEKFSNAQLVVVGSSLMGDKSEGKISAYEMEMHLLAEELLPPGTCRWTGWLSQAQLVQEYKKSYLAVFPSTWIEGFGMVALEAMACGLPVIASRRPGFSSLLGTGGGILLEDPTDFIKLADVILELLRDPTRAESLGGEGYQLAREYTVKKAANEFLKIVEFFK